MRVMAVAGRVASANLPALAAVFLVTVSTAGRELLPLVDAAKNADSVALRALLSEGASVNAAEVDGTTALHWASYRDDFDSADLLIRAGADVNATNDLGATPLWMASQNGSVAMVRSLSKAGANPNAALLLGETPVMVASRSGFPDVVELLAAKGADVNVAAARGQTALMWAVAQKHPAVVSVLLDHGADVHARSDTWTYVMATPPHAVRAYNSAIPHGDNTALMFAARVGDLASAKILVAAGADVNDTDAWGVSAMVLAAHSGYRELVEFLLQKGADPSADAAGFSALHVAIMRRDEKLVTTLLAHGADPNAPLRTWTPSRRASSDFHFTHALVGASPFWLAARLSASNIMHRLASAGADPLFVHHADYLTSAVAPRRKETTTALMAAMGMGGGRAREWATTPHAIRTRLSRKPVRVDRFEREALTLEAVKLAAELGVDVNAADTDGRTALDAATALGYETVVNFLVEQGARRGTE